MNTLPKKRIIAVGGGKGGVGKSTVTASLGMSIGRRKKPTLLIDADFASPNLHTVCGVPPPAVTVSDYLTDPRFPLEKALVRIDENTWLLSGIGTLLSLNGPTFKQRERIFRALNALEFDTLVFDLSAGAGRETMDLFMRAYHRIIVMEPTPLSVENAYLFLKNIIYRRLFRIFHQYPEYKAEVKNVTERKYGTVKNIGTLLELLSEIKPDEGDRLRREMLQCRYWLLVNRAKNGKALPIGTNFCTVSEEHLGIPVHPLAIIEEDPNVVRSLYRKEALPRIYPDTIFSHSIEQVVDLLLPDNEKT